MGEQLEEKEHLTAPSVVVSHDVAMATFRAAVDQLVADDPLLRDLPRGVTLDEVKSLIALEHGQAMAVHLKRGAKTTAVIVSQSATVDYLKQSVQRTISLELVIIPTHARAGCDKRINWRHIWRSNCLSFGGVRLQNGGRLLSDLGVRHKSQMRFVKRYRYKRGQQNKRIELDE